MAAQIFEPRKPMPRSTITGREPLRNASDRPGVNIVKTKAKTYKPVLKRGMYDG